MSGNRDCVTVDRSAIAWADPDVWASYAPNAHVFIALSEVHRLENKTLPADEIVEVPLGAYLGEDGRVRLQDIYERI